MNFTYYPFKGVYNPKNGRYILDVKIDDTTVIENWGSIPHQNLPFFKNLIEEYLDRDGFYNDEDFQKDFRNLKGYINPNRVICHY